MTNLRAAWLAPCVGTGGADALMSGLVRACRTVSFTGVGVLRSQLTSDRQVAWARAAGLDCGLHVWHDPEVRGCHPLPPQGDGVTSYRTALEAAQAAVADAEIVISWCCGGERVDMRDIYPRLGVPVIELSQNEDQMSQELLGYNAPAANYYAACSQAAARAFPPALRSKVNVIYNGIDPLRCAPRQGRELAREQLGYVDEDRVILFLGRFVGEKNPEAIVQALTLLPPEFKALFVGRGPEQGPLEDACKRYAPERCQVIEFVEHPGDLYAAADVFCLPSDFEGDPLAVHEAQMAGLPCVVAEYSAVDELEQLFGQLYWRVPRRPTNAQIADALREAVGDGQLAVGGRERMTRAREVTWQHFTLAAIAYQWEELLHDCLADWRERRLRGACRRLMHAAPITRAQ
jgi:glycosyltransferase involved in cell wall biosynthesis